jgi:hypothetical protein
MRETVRSFIDLILIVVVSLVVLLVLICASVVILFPNPFLRINSFSIVILSCLS